jgi:hypothetical protein
LTKEEYEEISRLRFTAGTGELRPYSQVKAFSNDEKPEPELVQEVVYSLIEKIKEPERQLEFDPGF